MCFHACHCCAGPSGNLSHCRVSMLQMFKILGLLCLSTAYSLSVMYLEGVKLGDLQVSRFPNMTAIEDMNVV